jgi:hypothetical protein
VHDARWIGALRWLALLALSIALSRAWVRRGDTRAALVNAALLPLLFADPGNTLYLDTFYAEWTALLGAYATIALALLWRDAARARHRMAWLALAAFVLATSKIQHLLLPMALMAVVLLVDGARLRRVTWRGVALGIGACAGLGVQFAQMHREGAMMQAIDQYNRADVVFTALLPFADDRRALLVELGIDPACVIYNAHHAWEFPDLPETVCSGLAGFTRGSELATLVRHPGLTLRLAGHSVLALDPWIAKNLGQVEGGDLATIPATMPGVGPLLHAWPLLQMALLALPPLGVLLLGSRRPRRAGRALELALLCTTLMFATLLVTVLGDGLADTAKQGHLIVNAALAFALVMLLGTMGRKATQPSPSR